MNKLLVVLGPTSTGKTDLALLLAKKFNGELVSCDSRQVYKELDIGTGKLPTDTTYEVIRIQPRRLNWEINGIKIWMYDVTNPDKQYTVYYYVKKANKVIANILKRGKLPIVIGGTGLYLKALLEGLPNLIIPINQQLRKELRKLSLQKLQNRLQKISLRRWKDMNNSDRQNPRRLIRAIEIATSVDTNPTAVGLVSTRNGAKMNYSAVNCGVSLQESSYVNHSSPKQALRYSGSIIKSDILKIGLAAPREILYKRIDERIVQRIDKGMVNEAKELHKNGLSLQRMKQLGLEYGVLADYLEGKISTREKLIKTLQGKIHGFAKRQLTWFKKEKNVCWFDITSRNYQDQVESKVNSWYHLNHG